MVKTSAGLLMYRRRGTDLEVLLVHPGGPFWKNKDVAAWSIPKGEYEPPDDPLATARREFAEETGFAVAGPLVPLDPIRQPSRKVVHAWAVEGDADPAALRSNTFTIEWPPRSGRRVEYPEVDRCGWFGLDEAAVKILEGQRGFLDQLARLAGLPPPGSERAVPPAR